MYSPARPPNAEFATRLHAILSTPDPSDTLAPDALAADAARHADRLHACQQTYLPGLSGDPEIDALATALWNACTRLGRAEASKEDGQMGKGENGNGNGNGNRKGSGGDGGEGERDANAKRRRTGGALGRLCLHGRVLAFHLLGVARPRGKAGFAGVVRLMRLGLKVVRDCIGRVLFSPLAFFWVEKKLCDDGGHRC